MCEAFYLFSYLSIMFPYQNYFIYVTFVAGFIFIINLLVIFQIILNFLLKGFHPL